MAKHQDKLVAACEPTDLVEEFLDQYRYGASSPKTLRNYESHLAALLAFVAGRKGHDVSARYPCRASGQSNLGASWAGLSFREGGAPWLQRFPMEDFIVVQRPRHNSFAIGASWDGLKAEAIRMSRRSAVNGST